MRKNPGKPYDGGRQSRELAELRVPQHGRKGVFLGKRQVKGN